MVLLDPFRHGVEQLQQRSTVGFKFDEIVRGRVAPVLAAIRGGRSRIVNVPRQGVNGCGNLLLDSIPISLPLRLTGDEFHVSIDTFPSSWAS